MEILTFQKCIGQEGKKHLILGNGFSLGIFQNIFNYKSLKEKIQSKHIKTLLERIGNHDFEYTLRKLTETSKVLENYKNASNIKLEIARDMKKLKTSLIDTISEHHPENPQSISDGQYNYCYEFLKHFRDGKTYTFNYDLLLYWVYMNFKDEKKNNLKCDDGFRYPEDSSTVAWEIGREISQNLYYIHGAMHIFSDSSQIKKYTWVNSGKTIKEQVKEALVDNNYPVFITEGCKEQKQKRINNNAYLGRCFSSLKSIGGNLFIYGHSLRDEDDHVFDFINHSNKKIKKVFISLYGDQDSEGNRKIVKKVNKWKENHKNKEYALFDAKTANVWEKNK